MIELWAAIDLMDGSVVTLVQGRPGEKTRWTEDPLQFAERWQTEGADGLHIIDLDAAFERGSNRETVMKIIKNASVPVQVGGGLRTEEVARRWLADGASRVIIGTMAYSQPSVLAKLLDSYGPERVVVAADYKDGEVVTKGWKEGQGISLESAVGKFERAGVTNLLTTSVGRDGTGSGPDVETISTLSRTTRMGIIASGGIRDGRDLENLAGAGARGAVIGKALYDGTLKLSEAKGGGA
jgi:phosphoribosylformimino-5-aminoimidazole carboxamide ribotide isomerase